MEKFSKTNEGLLAISKQAKLLLKKCFSFCYSKTLVNRKSVLLNEKDQKVLICLGFVDHFVVIIIIRLVFEIYAYPFGYFWRCKIYEILTMFFYHWFSV